MLSTGPIGPEVHGKTGKGNISFLHFWSGMIEFSPDYKKMLACFSPIADISKEFCQFSHLSFVQNSALRAFSRKLTSIALRTVGDSTKQPILNETKPSILETGQKRRFRKWDNTADFENETTIDSKVGQNRRFCKREQAAIKIVSDKSILA